MAYNYPAAPDYPGPGKPAPQDTGYQHPPPAYPGYQYPPAHPGYSGASPPSTNVININAPPPPMTVVAPVVVGVGSFHCNRCGYIGSPYVSRHLSTNAWIAALILLLVCWPLMCLPFCMDSCYIYLRSCPRC